MVITDSGGLQKESFFAKKKCIVVRDETEWIELVDNGSNILCKPSELYDVHSYFLKKDSNFFKNVYGNGKASNVIAKSIENFLKN
jgi:UDP-GlcNAc3NAcA epimerase